MEVVGFKRMADGSREDYEFLGQMERKLVDGLPDRILTQRR